jgi:hypothetical protein
MCKNFFSVSKNNFPLLSSFSLIWMGCGVSSFN